MRRETLPCKFGNGIGALRKFERQHRHDEHVTPGLVLPAKVNEFIAGQS